MDGMESNRIDGKDDVNIVDRLAVAFEGVLSRLRLVGRVKPLHGNAALDAGRSVPLIVGHTVHGSGHELQAALSPLPRLDIQSVLQRVRRALAFIRQHTQLVDV